MHKGAGNTLLNFTFRMTEPELGENLAKKRMETTVETTAAAAEGKVEPKAAREIASLLCRQFGLSSLPPQLQTLAEKGHDLLCPSNLTLVTAETSSIVGALQKRSDFQTKVIVSETGSLGVFYAEPFVNIRTVDGTRYFYGKVRSDALWPIINFAKTNTNPQNMWAVFKEKEPGIYTGYTDLQVEKIFNPQFGDFLLPQVRRITGNCGFINPRSLAEYVGTGGYFALARVLQQKTPQEVREEIAASGLRFGLVQGKPVLPAALSVDENGAAEISPDRLLLESDPHRVLEGLIIFAYALGVEEISIQLEPEFTLAAAVLSQALNDLKKEGILGAKILDTDFSLEVGLIYKESSFPAVRDTWGETPDMETLANIVWLMANGLRPGTKLFALTGDVKRCGIIEVPLGTDSRVVVEKIGGASPAAVKALRFGGPWGKIIPYHDFPLNSDQLSLGTDPDSGNITVWDQSHCMVQAAHQAVCLALRGQAGCEVCRPGLERLEKHLADLTGKSAEENILAEIEELCRKLAADCECGLGRAVISPVVTTLKHFREEYLAHLQGRCPALACRDMIRYEIDRTKCKACRSCLRSCAAGAIIKGSSAKKPYEIDPLLCNRCGRCVNACPVGCIRPVS